MFQLLFRFYFSVPLLSSSVCLSCFLSSYHHFSSKGTSIWTIGSTSRVFYTQLTNALSVALSERSNESATAPFCFRNRVHSKKHSRICKKSKPRIYRFPAPLVAVLWYNASNIALHGAQTFNKTGVPTCKTCFFRSMLWLR